MEKRSSKKGVCGLWRSVGGNVSVWSSVLWLEKY